MALELFKIFDDRFTQPIQNFVNTGASNLATAIDKPLRVAVILYIALYGFAVLRGAVRAPVMDVAWRAVKLCFIIALATKIDVYNEYVTKFFFEGLPKQISNGLAGSQTLQANSFDTLLNKGIDAGFKIMKTAVINPGPYVVAGIVFLATGIGTLIAFGISLFAKFALGLVLGLGPLFIAFALFSPTRRLTQSWIGQVLNYVILQALVTAVLLLIINVVEQVSAQTGSEIYLSGLMFMVLYGLCGFIALQLPGIASGLAGGGAALGLGLYAAATGKVAGAVAKGGAAGGASTAQAIGRQVGRAINKYRSKD